MKVRGIYNTQEPNNPPVFLLKTSLYQYIKPGDNVTLHRLFSNTFKEKSVRACSYNCNIAGKF